MSTIMYLRCVTHDPYLSSEEVGHSTSYLKQIREDIAKRGRIVQTMQGILDSPDGYPNFGTYQTNTWWFLLRHPRCELEIWDEYKKQYSLEGNELKPIEPITTLEEEWAKGLLKICVICGALPGHACELDRDSGLAMHIKRIWEDWK